MEPKKRWIDFKSINEKRRAEEDWKTFMEQSPLCPHFYWLEDKEEKVKFAKCSINEKGSCRIHFCPSLPTKKEEPHD